MTETIENAANTEKEMISDLLVKISAYIEQYHGGSVEMVDYDGKVLTVRLGGACRGCPLLPSTLHGWVEGTVRQFFPQVERVVDISEYEQR
jgi:Fe-S cluster biogenesis protein NfuA